MSRFRFRLVTVQRLREVARDERRAQLADALRVEAELNRQFAEVDELLSVIRVSQRIEPGQVDVEKLLEIQRYERVLQARRLALLDQRTNVLKELELRRAALVEADRDVKALEKLRDAQFEQWTLEQQRDEQKQLDETAVIGHWRKALTR